MVQYVKDFVRSMWLMAVTGIASAYGVFYAMQHHHYFAMGLFGLVLSVVMCAWAPYLEEKFKMEHSATKRQAFVFGILEMIMYSWQVVGGVSMFMICRMPMLIMHSASSMCYYHNRTKTMFWFWLCNHAGWNLIATFKPTWILRVGLNGQVRLTTLAIAIMLLWGTSLVCKVVRKKEVKVC